jgi:Short C-terminal domain
VQEQNGDWIRVKSADGDIGWVAAWLTYEDKNLSADTFQGGAKAMPAAAAEPATTAAPTASAAEDDPMTRLKKLKALYDAKLISEDEYNTKKQEILDKL